MREKLQQIKEIAEAQVENGSNPFVAVDDFQAILTLVEEIETEIGIDEILEIE